MAEADDCNTAPLMFEPLTRLFNVAVVVAVVVVVVTVIVAIVVAVVVVVTVVTVVVAIVVAIVVVVAVVVVVVDIHGIFIVLNILCVEYFQVRQIFLV